MIGSLKEMLAWGRFIPELMLGLLLFGLFLIIVLPTPGRAGAREIASSGSSENPIATRLLPIQGTPVVATINGSIDGTEPTFLGQRHFRSGIRGDRNCSLFGVSGARFYDEVAFLNSSPTTQRLTIEFTSACGSNTFMAAVAPQFNPSSICEGHIASSGLSGSVTWSFTVCANSQFSIVVYGLEPGVTCSGYSYTVFGSGVTLIGPVVAAGAHGAPPAAVDTGPFTESDVTIKKTKRIVPGTDVREKRIEPPGVRPPASLLPVGGTPLVAMVGDSIDGNEPRFINQRHFQTGIPGDANCSVVRPVSSGPLPTESHFYDEFFFFNNSPASERISVGFMPNCGFTAFMAAYSPQFDPNNICTNLIATCGLAAPVNWAFTVCANSQFSIVVYNSPADTSCPDYSFKVFGNGITFLGTVTDLSITKTAGPIVASGNITYLITVTNNGPNPAKNITITDTLPAGTRFFSLSSGPALCTTPPVGSPGTISCSLGLLAAPGTNLPTSLTLMLTASTMPSAGTFITNTAMVSRFGIEPTPANNSATVTTQVFDACVQDDSSGAVLSINSATGDYLFNGCQGTTVAGKGTVSVRGCVLTLQHAVGDRRVSARVDTCLKAGTASVQLLALGKTFQITDRSTSNNTCSCPAN